MPDVVFKSTLSGLRQILATESPLKVMKNALYFTSEALFILNIYVFIFTFWSCIETAWLKR